MYRLCPLHAMGTRRMQIRTDARCLNNVYPNITGDRHFSTLLTVFSHVGVWARTYLHGLIILFPQFDHARKTNGWFCVPWRLHSRQVIWLCTSVTVLSTVCTIQGVPPKSWVNLNQFINNIAKPSPRSISTIGTQPVICAKCSKDISD